MIQPMSANQPSARSDGGGGDQGPDAHSTVEIATSRVANPAFDVTPRRLVTAIVTERGVCAATRAGLAALFPEHAG